MSNQAINNYNDIHNKINKTFLNQDIIKKNKYNAKLLEDFFRYIKNMQLQVDNHYSPIRTAAFEAVIAQLKTEKKSKFDWSRLLKSGGFSFEDSIARLATLSEQALISNIDEKINTKSQADRLVGSKHANIKDMTQVEVDLNVLNDIITDETKNLLGSEFIMQGVVSSIQGKVDIQGNTDLAIHIKSNLKMPQKIMYLLATSNFSLKNYSSLRYDSEKNKYIPQGSTIIHLGASTLYRALYSILNYISAPNINNTIRQLILNSIEGDAEARKHLYHLRYIYELTGAGLTYVDGKDHGVVDYFIYNDPHTNNIAVKSTAEMIEQEFLTRSEYYGAALSKNIDMKRINDHLHSAYRKYGRQGKKLIM